MKRLIYTVLLIVCNTLWTFPSHADSVDAERGFSPTAKQCPTVTSRLSCDQHDMASQNRCQLSYGQISFNVHATSDSSLNQLSLEPAGLTIDNRELHAELDGTAYLAEIADLDGNGWPEVYVYVSSAGSGSYGSIAAWAVNNGKSLSPIYLPPLEQSPEAVPGYMGHDEFSIVENRLVRRYPLYRNGNTNAEPGGGARQLQYRLEPGEAGWIMVVDRVVDY